LWRPPNAFPFYFTGASTRKRFCSQRIQTFDSQYIYIVPDGTWPGITSGSDPGSSEIPASVAGYGVRGPCGPRTGNSSGVRPGNSCGCGGAPGSCTGGGISGRGFPGGSSCGGSVGVPGVAGGISGGSIGI
jgi:hypothetical protein